MKHSLETKIKISKATKLAMNRPEIKSGYTYKVDKEKLDLVLEQNKNIQIEIVILDFNKKTKEFNHECFRY
jgi:1,4-dihydroxy-2-naphthoyl-CoA synthase